MVLIFSEDPGLDPHINTGIRREMRWAGAASGQNTVTHGDTGHAWLLLPFYQIFTINAAHK